jgi:hypothetical protein
MSNAHKDKLIKLGYLFIVWMILLALIFGFVLFMIADEPLQDTKEKIAWCEEYHPNLTIEECSREAGW